ncbi:FadR family transcriptional regulator [Ktedonosporobacter rubrisoli]|uniref:FadR family transcriptional regulator n=1 Tax=Ktedonosporobacter rubrisoli TaxID=2509675 RepID=A0A4P6K0T7_KTERU|nr:FadR/GntR family transcriptional regulator [Ktedonosporobacter rubrisoli]QBD81412.1 FadR family transcriptional regulator [Ktedonosporobacter rubrisoli]
MNLDDTFTRVERRQLVDHVLIQLQKHISLGHYKPGDRLPTEPELMKQLGVGRSTIREAIRILVHGGLLEVRQGAGTFVKARQVSEETLHQRLRREDARNVQEVRRMLEGETAALAALRRTEEDLERIKHYLDRRSELLSAGNYVDYIDADIAFHLAIAEASKNALVVDLYSSFSAALHDYFSSSILDVDHFKDNTAVHEKIYQAIRDQDANRARELTFENVGLCHS